MIETVNNFVSSDATTQRMIAPVIDTLIATQAWSVGDYFIYAGELYKVTSAIAVGGSIIENTNCVKSDTVMEEVTHELLWTNVNNVATSQNITISGVTLSDYKFLEVYATEGGYCKIPTRNQSGVPTNYTGKLLDFTYASSVPSYGVLACSRDVIYDSQNNRIVTGNQVVSYVGAVGVIQNAELILKYIYGIKG